MTTPSTSRKAGPLLGTGSQTTWPFTFKVFAATDIAVTIADSLGVETALVYGVDFNVTLNANQETSPGGTVTYPISGAALPVGKRLVIIGNLPYDQPLDLPSGGNFSPLALENQLDRTVMQIQQLRENVGRALQLPVTAAGTLSVQLPQPAPNELIGWDSGGNNLANIPLSDIGTAIAFGTYRYDTFTGNGTTTSFALSEDPAVLANLDVSISGVVQVPGTDYSLVSGSLVFASAPANGTTILARYGQALTALPDSDQITFVQAGAGASTRTVQNKMRDAISVDDFGAVGNGVADDGPAVQRAINYVASLGRGTVTFTPGRTYLMDTQVNVCNNLTIIGYGAKIIAGRAWAHIDAPLFKNFTAARMSVAPGTVTATSNVAFYGLEIDGQDTGGAAGVSNANMHGLFICMGNRTDVASGVNGFTVQDCYLHDLDGAGVFTYGGENINVSDNRFVNFFPNTVLSIGSGLSLTDVDSFVVDANVFDHTGASWSWHGMTILDFNSRSKNGTVSNNVIRNMNQGDGISCEGNTVDNLENVTFVGNMIRDCAGDGIGVDNCTQVVVSSNTIQDIGGTGVLIGQTERLIIDGNSIINCGFGAIYGSGDKITIIGNSITGTSYGSASYQGDGILLVPTATSDSNSALISGNYLKDIAACGIVAQENTSIIGNFIFNAGRSASATRRQGIIAAADSIVIGNTVQSISNTSYGIQCSDNPCTMRDNQLLGTFTAGKAYVGYRGAISTGIVLNQNRVEMSGPLGTITIWDTTTPSTGYWIQGDVVYDTTPSASGYIGWVCTTTPSTWKTWGAITP